MAEITAFSQRDPRWANKQLGFCRGVTLGGAGCLVTSIAAMLQTWDVPTDPARLNAWLKFSDGYINGCNFVYRAVEPYGVKLRGIYRQPFGDAAGKAIQWAFYETGSAAIIALVDGQAKPGLQTHFVRMLPPEGNAWPIVDPWRLPGKEFIDLRAYMYGQDPEQGVKQIIIYEFIGGARHLANQDLDTYQANLYPLRDMELDAIISAV